MPARSNPSTTEMRYEPMDKSQLSTARFAYGDVPESLRGRKPCFFQTACNNGLSIPAMWTAVSAAACHHGPPGLQRADGRYEKRSLRRSSHQDASRICRRSSVSTTYIEGNLPGTRGPVPECQLTLRQKSHGHPAGCPRQQQKKPDKRSLLRQTEHPDFKKKKRFLLIRAFSSFFF